MKGKRYWLFRFSHAVTGQTTPTCVVDDCAADAVFLIGGPDERAVVGRADWIFSPICEKHLAQLAPEVELAPEYGIDT